MSEHFKKGTSQPNTRILSISLLQLRECAKSLAIILCLGASWSHAGPWVEPGDTRTRHHLQVLADAGVINTTITAWPVMWSNIRGALDQVDVKKIGPHELWSFQFLKHELRKAQKPIQLSGFSAANSQMPLLSDFDRPLREQYTASVNANFTGKLTSLNIRASYHHDPSDDHSARADGSYLTRLLGNWAVGIGNIDRWWGPGWENSMILSNNARPMPGIFLQRNVAAPFETPLLSWLGPWQLTTFMNQFESEDHRVTGDARLWGMRVSFRPLKQLEIGLSRTAMWAGDGRPGDADTFLRLLIGDDNRGDDGVDADNEPGNQLGGIDLRWSQHLNRWGSLALYAQLIGEDEANSLPSRHIGMAGMEYSGLIWGVQHRLILEAANSTVYFYDKPKIAYNVAYEHPIYPSGYRYYGRSLGASMDNDGESVTLKYQGYFDNGHSVNAKIASVHINNDGTNTGIVDAPGNAFGADAQKVNLIELNYSFPLSRRTLAKVGVAGQDEPLTAYGETSKTRTFFTLESLW